MAVIRQHIQPALYLKHTLYPSHDRHCTGCTKRRTHVDRSVDAIAVMKRWTFRKTEALWVSLCPVMVLLVSRSSSSGAPDKHASWSCYCAGLSIIAHRGAPRVWDDDVAGIGVSVSPVNENIHVSCLSQPDISERSQPLRLD